MEILYKLTDRHDCTMGDTKWGEGVTHKPFITDYDSYHLCSYTVIHAYRNPLVALFLSPSHVEYWKTGILWEAKGIVKVWDHVKVGCSTLTTIKKIQNLSKVTMKQRVAFACFLALQDKWTSLSAKDDVRHWLKNGCPYYSYNSNVFLNTIFQCYKDKDNQSVAEEAANMAEFKGRYTDKQILKAAHQAMYVY